MDTQPEGHLERLHYELWLNGFVPFPGFLPHDLLGEMREHVRPLVEAERSLVRAGRSTSLRCENRLTVDLKPWFAAFPGALDDPRFRRHPSVIELVTMALGAWREGSLKLECPLPGSAYMGWHPDTSHPEIDRPYRMRRLTLNVALVDIDERNGPMEIIPGSHRLHHDRRRPSPDMHCFARPMLMRAGDAFLRDSNGLHRGTPNLTGEPRPLLGLTFWAIDGDPEAISS